MSSAFIGLNYVITVKFIRERRPTYAIRIGSHESLPHTQTSQEISEHTRYEDFSAVLPRCETLSKLVACCGREMHCLLEP